MKHISVLILCLLLCHIGRAQTGKAFMTSPDGGMYAYKKINHTLYDTTDVNVFYKVSFLPDSTKKDKYKDGQTLLMISDDYTWFGDYYKIKADSVNNYLAKSKKNAHDKKANDDFNMLVTKTTFDYIMLADLKSSQTTVQLRSPLNRYQYTYLTPQIQWTLLPGDTLINNIPCKKATCRYAGRNFIAWYAESMPLPYGPFVFSGLPGLVMKLYEDKLNWIFTNNGISKAAPTDMMYLYKDKRYKKTTREKALSAYRNENENFVSIAIESGVMTVVKKGPDFDKMMAPRPTNMLELEW